MSRDATKLLIRGLFSLVRHVTAYPANLNKPKALAVCNAFAQGVIVCGGAAKVCETIPERLEPGDAFFYGVRPSIAHLWEQAKSEGRDWWYADNAYFDSVRERYFRVTKNKIQHSGAGRSEGRRFALFEIGIKPWRRGGDYALVCAQSEEFMRSVAKDSDWLKRTIAELRMPFIVRHKDTKRSFAEDLKHAKVVITWSSAAAVMALLDGVPVVCSEQCAAYGVTDRQKWAEVLADNQWDLSEIRRGDAWRSLNA